MLHNNPNHDQYVNQTLEHEIEPRVTVKESDAKTLEAIKQAFKLSQNGYEFIIKNGRIDVLHYPESCDSVQDNSDSADFEQWVPNIDASLGYNKNGSDTVAIGDTEKTNTIEDPIDIVKQLLGDNFIDITNMPRAEYNTLLEKERRAGYGKQPSILRWENDTE